MERIEADVAIIGGGTAGCSTALFLRRRGLTVILLESRLVGSQASGVNFGGVRQSGRNPVELPLALRSRELWGHLPDIVGHHCEFAPTGHLKLARTEDAMQVLEQYAEEIRDSGLKVELLGRTAIRTKYPWLGDSIIGGSFCASDGHANPRLVAPAFARAARAAGAEIREYTPVDGAAWDGSRFKLSSETGIEVSARHLVITAGAWSDKLSTRFNENLPIDPGSPNLNVTEPVHYFIEPYVAIATGKKYAAGVYMRQIPRGNVIFGGGGWDGGAGGRGIADRDGVRAYPLSESSLDQARALLEVVPRLAETRLIRTWGGIEGYTPDRLPFLGPSQTTPNLVYGFGFSGHGFAFGPGVGMVLSEMVVDGKTSTPIDSFSITRFCTEEPSDKGQSANLLG